MLVPTLPFDYAVLVDVTDRVRRAKPRRAGGRVRRTTSSERGMP